MSFLSFQEFLTYFSKDITMLAHSGQLEGYLKQYVDFCSISIISSPICLNCTGSMRTCMSECRSLPVFIGLRMANIDRFIT